MSEQWELKPCPFCGGEAEATHNTGASQVYCKDTDNCCMGLVDTKSPYLDDVIAKWNTRPLESENEKLKANVEVLKSACEKVIGENYEYDALVNAILIVEFEVGDIDYVEDSEVVK